MLSKAEKPFLLYNEFTKMQNISLLAPPLRNEASNGATMDGQWDLLDNSMSLPFPVLELPRTQHPCLSTSISSTVTAYLPSIYRLPCGVHDLPPDPTVTKDDAKAQGPCHFKRNLPGKKLPRSTAREMWGTHR